MRAYFLATLTTDPQVEVEKFVVGAFAHTTCTLLLWCQAVQVADFNPRLDLTAKHQLLFMAQQWVLAS